MAKKITVEEAIERFSEVTKIIAEAIFAQIERPGAQWIADEYEYYHCSACGYEHPESEYKTAYCPRCGCKMKAGADTGRSATLSADVQNAALKRERKKRNERN